MDEGTLGASVPEASRVVVASGLEELRFEAVLVGGRQKSDPLLNS